MYHRAQAGMSPHPPTGGWSALRRTYPRTVAVLATLIALFLVGDVLLAARFLGSAITRPGAGRMIYRPVAHVHSEEQRDVYGISDS